MEVDSYAQAYFSGLFTHVIISMCTFYLDKYTIHVGFTTNCSEAQLLVHIHWNFHLPVQCKYISTYLNCICW